MFKGSIVALVTPMLSNGDVDFSQLEALINFHVNEGTQALVIAGTTGESATLSIDEKLTLFEAVAGAVTVPVVAGTTGSNTRQDIGLTVEAEKLGVAGILAVCPYYNRPSQAGIETHFRAIAASSASVGKPRISMCDATDRIRLRNSSWKPFITDRTTISAATPSAIPAIDVAEMKGMKRLRPEPRRARV